MLRILSIVVDVDEDMILQQFEGATVTEDQMDILDTHNEDSEDQDINSSDHIQVADQPQLLL